ncbi:MAG: phage portal protein [Oscillospiraceae bacterium]|nr:phage portal protein [Oscillospiraceae bacterium]MCI9551508.1 phage portal protein [Oscillospiraceae bacterium]
MGLPARNRRERGTAAAAAQLRDGGRHPFVQLDGYTPLGAGEAALYRAVREAVPVVDAAIGKLVRLCGGLRVECRDERAREGLERFIRTVNVGRGQRGLQAFLDQYLDSMFVCGRAVGEIVPTADGRDIAAVLCGDVGRIEIREGDSPLDFALCARDSGGRVRELPRQELLLFTPYQPETGSPYGVSMLRSMPFLAEILVKIFQAVGKNWERTGNVRFAVTCGGGDAAAAQERCAQVAREWSAAMQAGRDGAVRDFVCAGDVGIRTIGADNQILDSEVPVRQILEQLVAKTGIPPFLLGLSWSSTERMSSQQADILTSEIAAIRRSLEPVAERICEWWLRLKGYDDRVKVDWLDVNLQDEESEARAALYRAQARAMEEERQDGDL